VHDALTGARSMQAMSRPSDFLRLAGRLRLPEPRASVERVRLEASLRQAEARAGELLASQLRMNQRGGALMAAARRLARETARDVVYRVGLDVVESQLEGASAFIAHADRRTTTFCARACGTRAGDLRVALAGRAEPASFGAEVLAGGAAAVLPDPRYAFDAVLLGAGIAALVAAAIGPPNADLPVLVAGWGGARSCPPEDVWFLEHLAALLALALR
jgi:hypothetical protein